MVMSSCGKWLFAWRFFRKSFLYYIEEGANTARGITARYAPYRGSWGDRLENAEQPRCLENGN